MFDEFCHISNQCASRKTAYIDLFQFHSTHSYPPNLLLLFFLGFHSNTVMHRHSYVGSFKYLYYKMFAQPICLYVYIYKFWSWAEKWDSLDLSLQPLLISYLLLFTFPRSFKTLFSSSRLHIYFQLGRLGMGDGVSVIHQELQRHYGNKNTQTRQKSGRWVIGW